MNFTCNECNDTGSRDKSGDYLDCGHCDAAMQRAAINDFLDKLPAMGDYDAAWLVHQRALAMAPKQEAPEQSAWKVKMMADYAPRAIPGLAPEPFILGNQYRTQGGRLVRFVSIANEGNSYETMADELGHHRYTRRDFGRGTGAAWDDDCVPPLYTAPAPIAAPAAANGALPELPAPETLIVESDLGHRAYTADQMRAYGQACAASGLDAALVARIHKAQSILAKHLPPGGPDEFTTINELLGLLDGPESRAALKPYGDV